MSAMMIESKCGIVQCSLSSMKYEFRKTMAHSLTLSVQDFIRPALLFANNYHHEHHISKEKKKILHTGKPKETAEENGNR